jgi:hypothetical protein
MSQQGPDAIDFVIQKFYEIFNEDDFPTFCWVWHNNEVDAQVIAGFPEHATDEQHQANLNRLISWLNEWQISLFRIPFEFEQLKHNNIFLKRLNQGIKQIIANCPHLRSVAVLDKTVEDDFNNVFQNTKIRSFTFNCNDPATVKKIAQGFKKTSIREVKFWGDSAGILALVEGLAVTDVNKLTFHNTNLTTEDFAPFLTLIPNTKLTTIVGTTSCPPETYEGSDFQKRDLLLAPVLAEQRKIHDPFGYGYQTAMALHNILIPDVNKLMLGYVDSSDALAKDYDRAISVEPKALPLPKVDDKELGGFGCFLLKSFQEGKLENVLRTMITNKYSTARIWDPAEVAKILKLRNKFVGLIPEFCGIVRAMHNSMPSPEALSLSASTPVFSSSSSSSSPLSSLSAAALNSSSSSAAIAHSYSLALSLGALPEAPDPDELEDVDMKPATCKRKGDRKHQKPEKP